MGTHVILIEIFFHGKDKFLHKFNYVSFCRSDSIATVAYLVTVFLGGYMHSPNRWWLGEFLFKGKKVLSIQDQPS